MIRNAYYMDANGRRISPQPVNRNGVPVTEYDEHIVWASDDFDPNTNSAVYSDRMWELNGEKYYAAVRTIWPETPGRQLFHGITEQEASLLLNLYFGHAVKLTAILTGKNAHNGYPYWVFGYVNLDGHCTCEITMRNVITTHLPELSEVKTPDKWRFPSYKLAYDDMTDIVADCLQALRTNMPNTNFSTESDDLSDILSSHTAAIYMQQTTEPVATFDIFGLAEFTDKYGTTHWYYRGVHMTRKAHGKNIYIMSFKDEKPVWRGSLSAILSYIDNQRANTTIHHDTNDGAMTLLESMGFMAR